MRSVRGSTDKERKKKEETKWLPCRLLMSSFILKRILCGILLFGFMNKLLICRNITPNFIMK